MEEGKLKHVVDIHGVVRKVKEKEDLTDEEYIAEQARLREEREKKSLNLSPEEYEEWLKTKGGRGVKKDQTQEEAIKQRKGEVVGSSEKKPTKKLYSTLEQKRIAEEKELARQQAEYEERQAELEKIKQPTNTHEDLLDESLEKDKEKRRNFFEEFRFLIVTVAIIVAIPLLSNILGIKEEKEVDLIPQNTVNIQEDLTENSMSVLGFIFKTIIGVFENIFSVIKSLINLLL